MARKKKRKLVDNLNHRKQPRVRAEVIDYDYVDTLSEQDKQWLGKFTDEYVGASINVGKSGKPAKGSIHKTQEQVKSCRDANNWRNNDVYGVNRAFSRLHYVQTDLDNSNDNFHITNPEYTEMEINANLDSNEQNEHLSLLEYLECRGNMLEERVTELDDYYRRSIGYTSDDYYLLIIIYNSGEVTKSQIVKMSENNKLLKKFIQNSQLFKPKNKGTDNT